MDNASRDSSITERSHDLIRDTFITCSVDRDRSYVLAIDLELENPFKTIDVSYEIPSAAIKRDGNNSIVAKEADMKRPNGGRFRIRLPQSTFLVRLNQRIRYDECIVINYVQLAPNLNYDIECMDCEPHEQRYLDRVFSKRMTQLDSELDSILSEKLLLGLQLLINQERLDLELFME